MSEDQNTQTAVDAANAQAQPGTAAPADARTTDGLDAALNEFDAATRTPSSTPEPKPAAAAPAAADDDFKRRVETLEKTIAEQNFRQTVTPVLAKVRGDVPADVFDDDEMIGWLDAKAKKDPRLQNAWVNRDKNPAAWDRVVEGLGREFGKKFSRPIDERVTADREAVTAAVRGASNKAPEGKPPDLSGMTAAELREFSKKNYGFTPPV